MSCEANLNYSITPSDFGSVIFLPDVDTAYFCQGDSIQLGSIPGFISYPGGSTFTIDVTSQVWSQATTCSQYNSTPLITTAPYLSGTSLKLNLRLNTPGMFLFTISANCIEVLEGDTLNVTQIIDNVFISVYPAPPANAGTDTLSCLTTGPGFPWYVELNATNPTPYTGTWTVGGLLDSLYNIISPNNPNTGVAFTYPGSGPTNYTSNFIWTVTGEGGCFRSDQVTIYHPQELSYVDIYQDNLITVCSNQMQFGPGAQGDGATSTYGGFTVPFPTLVNTLGDTVYYQWIEIGPMNDTLVTYNYNNQNTEIVVDSAGYYTFVLTVYGYCGTYRDTAYLHFLSDTAVVSPGVINLTNCSQQDTLLIYHTIPGAMDTVSYAFVQPPGGAGASIVPVSNNSFSLQNIDTTQAYYKIQYTFSMGTGCVRSDFITITNRRWPTLFVQDVTLPCGLTEYEFDTLIAGYGPSQSISLITQADPGAYIVDQTIYDMDQPGVYQILVTHTSLCLNVVSDTITINMLGPAPPASAGSPIIVPCGESTTNLNGNSPVWGVGAWRVSHSAGLPPSHPDFNMGASFYNIWAFSNFSDTTIANPTVSGLLYPGLYQFTWYINGTEDCGDHWDIINVYVPDPILDSANAGPDTLICDTTDFWLNALENQNMSGQWSQDSSNFNLVTFSQADSTTTQVFGMLPGHNYQFIYTLNGACNHPSDTITVYYNPDNCCFADISPLYQHWRNDTLINVGTVLSGKYYVDAMVTVSSWLDITNVYMVFGLCGGITFIDSAQIRANNSVFRPCFYNDTWKGFIWEAQKNSIIESCTFKNAYRALDIGHNGNVQIKNNLFSNCATAIYLDGTIQNEAITGNTIVWDTWLDSLFVHICEDLTPQTNSVSGIVGFDAYVKTIVSGNEFISVNNQNTFTPDGNLRFEGVYFIGGSIHLANNRFTNNSVAFSGAAVETYFTNNTVETNTNHLEHWADVFLDSISFASINGNRFVNYVRYEEEWGYDKDAIYILNSTGAVISIEHNYAEGYSNAFVVRNCKAEVFIYENEITDVVQNGIYCENSSVAISCNQINAKLSDTYLPTGIRLYNDERSFDFIKNSVIRSNCIYETHIAILIEGPRDTLVDTKAHIITNNMLYNYNEVGLYVIGYSLQSGPGNSYISNNAANGFAADIHTSLANVVSFYDYGANILSPDLPNGRWIRKYFADSLHSTASCGNQISEYTLNYQNQEQTTNTYTVCLPVKLDSANVQEDIGWGSFALGENAMENLQSLPTKDADIKAIVAFDLCAMNQRTYSTYQTFNALKTLPNLSPKGKATLEINFRMWEQDYQKALAIIQAFSPQNDEQQEWKIITEREINHLIHNQTFTVVENWDKLNLKSERNIDFQERYIHAVNRTRPITVKPVEKVTKPNFSTINITSNSPQISVYPNPVENEISLLINCRGKQPLQIQITDISGAIVYRQNTLLSFGTVQIPVQHLSPGLYLINLTDASGNFTSRKFVKQ